MGHEIVGHVVKVGEKAKRGFKTGDRVGVGGQAGAWKCDRCLSDNESYCPKLIGAFSTLDEDGQTARGGYSSHFRVNENYAVLIPENIPSEFAAPLLCGDLTVYSPLVRNGCTPGTKIGIVGIGGVGHMGIIIGEALGAEVFAISRHSSKKSDSPSLGADHYIATLEDEDWEGEYANTLDLVLICSSSLTKIDFKKLVKLMKCEESIISVSQPAAEETLTSTPSPSKAEDKRTSWTSLVTHKPYRKKLFKGLMIMFGAVGTGTFDITFFGPTIYAHLGFNHQQQLYLQEAINLWEFLANL